MNIGNKTLADLDDKAKKSNENAIIIIDAINEGADNIFWKRALMTISNELGNHLKCTHAIDRTYLEKYLKENDLSMIYYT